MFANLESSVRAAGRRVVESYPAATGPLVALRSWYARAHLLWIRERSRLRHDAVIDPFRVVWIDLDALELTAEHFEGIPKYRRAGRLAGGDWDQDTERFRDRTIYRSFAAHFDDGVPWSETEFYESIVDRLESGESWWDCTTEAEFQERCRRLDELYDRIAEHGLLSQEELAAKGYDEPITKERSSTFSRTLEDEIAVHVGRNGEFLFCDGRNRLAIAKVLDVDEIPVRIMVRHEEWQAFRDDVAAGRVDPGEYATHPDVRPLLD
ncbi:hypothetical protein [Haloarchaeobius sp. HRN-SO-5]|uniref:hypothetical protein n=1 Tax=Haloarchaeobius sp. HRN-SO-5 TaxID=3446118 RepID=UPI003EBE4827